MHSFRDLEKMALTLFGEARGESNSGIYAVGCVIYNRWLKRRKKSPSVRIQDICLQPRQFSCWNDEDPNNYLILTVQVDHAKMDVCIKEALFILSMSGKHTDYTVGATHYHTKAILPYWAKGKNPCYEVGNHVFYNDID